MSDKYIHVGTDEQAMILNTIQDCSAALRDDIATLHQRLDSTLAKLDEGYHVNSLGELQLQGPRFDQRCALRVNVLEVHENGDFTVQGVSPGPEDGHIWTLLAYELCNGLAAMSPMSNTDELTS